MAGYKKLKSTIELQSRTRPTAQSETPVNQHHALTQEAADVRTSPEECRHACCKALNEKLHENQICLLEMQMMQNMYLQNAMHIQLVSQMKTHSQVPDHQNWPHPAGMYQHYAIPHQQPGLTHMVRPLYAYQQFPPRMYYQPMPTAYTGANLPRFPSVPPPTYTPQPYGNIQHTGYMNGNNIGPSGLYNQTQPSGDTLVFPLATFSMARRHAPFSHCHALFLKVHIMPYILVKKS